MVVLNGAFVFAELIGGVAFKSLALLIATLLGAALGELLLDDVEAALESTTLRQGQRTVK